MLWPLAAAGVGLIYVGNKLYEDWKRSKDTLHGFERELAIGRYLARTGATVRVSDGSRGAADVTAIWPGNKTWLIQAKSSRTGVPQMPGPDERRRLQCVANLNRAAAVIALVAGTRTRYFDAWTGDRVYPPGTTRGSTARSSKRRR